MHPMKLKLVVYILFKFKNFKNRNFFRKSRSVIPWVPTFLQNSRLIISIMMIFYFLKPNKVLDSLVGEDNALNTISSHWCKRLLSINWISNIEFSFLDNHIYHTTKITTTFVISHFDIVWYYQNSIPLKYHIF